MSDPYGYPPQYDQQQHDQWGPPQPPAGQQWGPPPPPPAKKKRKKWPWVVGGLVLVIVIAAAAGSGGGDKKDDTNSAQPAVSATSGSEPAAPADDDALSGPTQHAEDYAILSCGRDPATGWGKAQVRVTNHSSKPSNYAGEVAFESADGSQQFGSAPIAVNGLRPGQTTVQDAGTLDDAPAGVKCRLSDATRYAA